MSHPEPGWLLGCNRELDLVATAADVLSVSAVGDDLGDTLTAVVRLIAALDALRAAGAVGIDDIINASSAQEGRLHAIISGQVRSCNALFQLPSWRLCVPERGSAPLSVSKAAAAAAFSFMRAALVLYEIALHASRSAALMQSPANLAAWVMHLN